MQHAPARLTPPTSPIAAFAPLSLPPWERLANVGVRKTLRPKDEMYTQEAMPVSVYSIESGVVKLVRLAPDGDELILGLRAEGWLLDAACAVLKRPPVSSAIAVTDCTVRAIPLERLTAMLDRSPELLADVCRMLCMEIEAEREQQMAFRCGNAQSRLNRLIRELARANRPIDALPLKQVEIAQLLSITPEHLSRLLH